MTIYETVLPGGKHWSFIVRRGTVLRLTDIEGGGNAAMLLYNPQNLLERYNAPDTLKCQHTVYLTTGRCLYSDMGRIFCSVIADDLGWHDTIGGTSSRQGVAAQCGEQSYQQSLNDWTQNGRDAFLVEAAKYGLGRRDLAANVNFFAKVSVDTDGAMCFHADHSPPGSQVDIRFEMDTLVLLHTCPHPMNPAATYPRRPIGIALRPADKVAEDDICLTATPENRRGFRNNEIYHQCAGQFPC
jgi:urea carboxylase-associated protein 2